MSPSWLRRTTDYTQPPQPQPPSSQSPSPIPSGDPNLTTCLYQTDHGVFYLTWSRTFLGGHSINLFLHSQDYYNNHSSPLSFSTADLSLSSAVSFHLNLNTLSFWKKKGSKFISPKIQVFWDLTKAKFESGSEPRSGFFISVIVDGEIGLLIGDLVKEAYFRTRAKPPITPQALLLRKEHVFGARVFRTKAKIGGKIKEILIDCRVDEDAKLCFFVDSKEVLRIKRLRWKFRGNEKVEIDGVNVQISWDVYNWLFQSKNSDHAVFMFRFENDPETEIKGEEDEERKLNGVVLWKKPSFGIKGIVEWRKMRKRFGKSKRSSSSSSISMSSASSACSSSVMEWASSADEAEYGGCGGGYSGCGSGHGLGFSLLVYAWIK